MTEQEIFFAALDQATPEARAAYVAGACGHDILLRSKVEALLKEHFSNDSLLNEPAADGVPTRLDDSPVLEGPGTQIGRYKLLQKLGEGGFGVVYMAEQKEPVKRRVALKIIKLGMDTRQIVARFEAERQALAMMDHPNIAKVHDAGATETGRPYFVMELVKGVPITKYCDDNELTTQERLELFIPVCQAIQHAHQKGIIHRDIKPSNVMITLHDGVPVPKVIDFGIAKATQQELTEKTIFTQYSQFIGTPAYMSPEQAEMSGLDIDTRSDIYSLGVVLYELLVGRTPLDARELLSGGFEEIRRRIKEQEPAKPSTRISTLTDAEMTTVARRRKLSPAQLRCQLRGDLDWMVLKALEKDRSRRYETANGFALDLKRYLANEPVTAVAPSPGYVLGKYVRRHRTALTIAAAIGALLIVGTTVSTWEAIRATRAGRSEKQQRLTAQGAQAAEQVARFQAQKEKEQFQHLLYVADINVADQAGEQNNLGRVREMLRETATFAERGFEWYYWQRQTHLEIKTLRGHTDWIGSVAFSPDGRHILTASGDQTAKVWDALDGKEQLTLKGHGDALLGAAFSPDSQRIVTGSYDKTAKIWDASTGKELCTLQGHSDLVHAVAFSSDGQRIVTTSKDATARIWESTSGNPLLTFTNHTAWVNAAAFSPNGEQIVTGSDDQTAKVWNAVTGQELLTLKGHHDNVQAVAFSPDGQRIATGGNDRTAKIWDAATGKELLTFEGHKDQVFSVAFSPDGKRIVTGSWDQTAKVWDAMTGRELRTLKGHSHEIWSVAFSPDGRRIVTGSFDETAKIWDAVNDNELLTLRGHSNSINCALFSSDGRRIATASFDHTAKIWDAGSGEELLTLEGHSAEVKCAVFSPNGQRIATSSEDHTGRVWDAFSGKALLVLQGLTNGIGTLAFSPDGQRIVAGGGGDRDAKVWDAATGKLLFTLKGHRDWVGTVAFSPDGKRIVTASGDRTAKVWDAATGKELLTLPHRKWVGPITFSSDSQRILTGGGDQAAKVWETASGKELLTLKGHSDQIRSLAFSPDGQRVITGSQDRTTRIWDVATGKELLTLRGHAGAINSVAFSPDGQRIVTGSADGTANVWTAATPEQVGAWQEEKRAAERDLTTQGEGTAE